MLITQVTSLLDSSRYALPRQSGMNLEMLRSMDANHLHSGDLCGAVHATAWQYSAYGVWPLINAIETSIACRQYSRHLCGSILRARVRVYAGMLWIAESRSSMAGTCNREALVPHYANKYIHEWMLSSLGMRAGASEH